MSAPDTDISTPIICTWMGKDIENMSKEELVLAVKELGRDAERERERHQHTLDLWKAARGERL